MITLCILCVNTAMIVTSCCHGYGASASSSFLLCWIIHFFCFLPVTLSTPAFFFYMLIYYFQLPAPEWRRGCSTVLEVFVRLCVCVLVVHVYAHPFKHPHLPRLNRHWNRCATMGKINFLIRDPPLQPARASVSAACSYKNVLFLPLPFINLLSAQAWILSSLSITIHLQSHLAAYIKLAFFPRELAAFTCSTSDRISRLSGDLSRKVKHQSAKRVLYTAAHLGFSPGTYTLIGSVGVW